MILNDELAKRDEVFRRLQGEDAASNYLVNGNNGQLPYFIHQINAADEFSRRALDLLRPFADEEKRKSEEYIVLRNGLVKELLQKQLLSPSLMRFRYGIELDALITSACAIDTIENIGKFLGPWPTLVQGAYDVGQMELAERILLGMVSSFEEMKGDHRVRKQRRNRRFRKTVQILSGRQAGRRFFGFFRMELFLNPGRANKDDVAALAHFRGALLKDWKKKEVFEGVQDYIWFLLPDWYKGAVLHVFFLVDIGVSPNLAAMAERIGAYWNGSITKGIGYSTQNAYFLNQGVIVPNQACVIDVADSIAVGRVMDDVRYMCEREMLLRLKESDAKETFGDASVSDSHWETRQERQKAAATHLPVSPSLFMGNFRPVEESSDEAASTKLFLGFDFAAAESVYHRPAVLANGHFLLFGPSGSGKTTVLLSYSHELIRNKIPFVVLDPHNQALAKLPIPTAVVSNGTTGASGVNPLRLYFAEWEKRGKDGQVADKIEMINLCAGNSLGHREKDILKKALMGLYARSGLTEALPAEGWICPTCSELIEMLEGYLKDPAWKASRKSVEGVLAAVRTSFGNRVFNQASSLDARECLEGKSLRIDLSGLEGAEQGIVMEAFLRDVWNCCKDFGPDKAGGGSIRLVVVIDEAHLLNLGGNPSAAGRMLNVLTREVRKFGVCVVVATQSLEDLSETVRKNTAAWMVFRLNDDAEARAVARKFRVSAEAILGLNNASEAFFWDGRSLAANRIELARQSEDEIDLYADDPDPPKGSIPDYYD